MKKQPIIIGICGGSGSGKTTIAKMIQEKFPNSSYLSMDFYYNDNEHLTLEERKKINFDEPKSIDMKLLRSDISKLLNGEDIYHPVYDFSISTRTGYVDEPTRAEDVIVIDGILLFSDAELRDLLTYKIFVSTDDDIRFIRRLLRDVEERGRSVESVVNQYLTSVKPMYYEHVSKYKVYSDWIIYNNHFEMDILASEVNDVIYPKITKFIEEK